MHANYKTKPTSALKSKPQTKKKLLVESSDSEQEQTSNNSSSSSSLESLDNESDNKAGKSDTNLDVDGHRKHDSNYTGSCQNLMLVKSQFLRLTGQCFSMINIVISACLGYLLFCVSSFVFSDMLHLHSSMLIDSLVSSSVRPLRSQARCSRVPLRQNMEWGEWLDVTSPMLPYRWAFSDLFSCIDFYCFRLVLHSPLSNCGTKRTPISTTRISMLRLSTFSKLIQRMNLLLKLSNTGTSMCILVVFFLHDFWVSSVW